MTENHRIAFRMALFARRQVQEAIDHCGTFMPMEALARKIAELNASNENSLPAEWEVMLTAATARHCPVQYEPDLGGARKADLLVTPDGHGTPGCLVEITTISDEHAHKKNPYDTVSAAIRGKIRKLGGPAAGWALQVEGTQIGKYRDAEVRLLLGTGRPEDLFDHRFFDFVRQVKAKPETRHVHEWRGDMLNMTLTFDPRQPHNGGGHLVYTVVHSLKRNPLAGALRSKTKQLRQTGHDGPYGVVVCDGGCHVLSDRLTGSGTSFSIRDVLEEFFRVDRHLSFVLVVGVETTLPPIFGHRTCGHELRVLPCLRQGSAPVATQALDRLTRAARSLPPPLTSPGNAVRCYVRKYENEWWRFPGRSVTVSEQRIKISARALLEMLAGRKTPAEYFKAFQDNWMMSGNFFNRQRLEGRCISGVKFVEGAADDDEIEFSFGPPDAAASKYRPPAPAPMPKPEHPQSGSGSANEGRPAEPKSDGL